MDIDAIHKTLANPVRRQILQWLKEPEQYFCEQEHSLDFGVCAGPIDQQAGSVAIDGLGPPDHPAKAHLISARKADQWSFFKRNEATLQAFLVHLQQGL